MSDVWVTRIRVSLSIEVFPAYLRKNGRRPTAKPVVQVDATDASGQRRSHPPSIDRRDLCHVMFPLLPIFFTATAGRESGWWQRQ